MVSFANAYLITGTSVLIDVAFQIKDVRAEIGVGAEIKTFGG